MNDYYNGLSRSVNINARKACSRTVIMHFVHASERYGYSSRTYWGLIRFIRNSISCLFEFSLQKVNYCPFKGI